MESFKQYWGLDKQIYFLALVRCVNTMGAMFVFPFTSLLLTQVLGYSAFAAGILVVITAIINAVCNLIGGKLSDSFSCKKIILISYFAVVILMLISSFICTRRIVIVFIFAAHGIICIALPAISALVLDKCSFYKRSESLSLLYLASNIGSALGPLVAGLLFYSHTPLIFIIMAGAFVLTFTITLVTVSDAPASLTSNPEENAREINSIYSKDSNFIKILLEDRILLIYVIILALITLCYSSFGYMLPLHFTEMLGPKLGSRFYSFIWTINGLFIVIATPFLISMTKKSSQLLCTVISCLLYTVGYAVYAVTESPFLFYAAVIVWTSGEILVSTGAAVFVSNRSPDTHKGRAMAIYEFARTSGRCIGPLVFGYLITICSFAVTWAVISLICLGLAVTALMLYFYEKKKRDG